MIRRIIKKYPNRRLYDTQDSAYISLADVKALVLRFEPILVQDSKTGEDLTRSLLLQVLLEEETLGVPLFTEAALCNLIRFYGQSNQPLLAQLFERNTQALVDLQAQIAPLAPFAAATGGPASWLAQPVQAMTHLQEQWQAQLGGLLAAAVGTPDYPTTQPAKAAAATQSRRKRAVP